MAEVFGSIDWGTPSVLAQTLSCADRYQLPVGILPQLPDVDRPDDIAIWETVQQAQSTRAKYAAPRLSVIIPTLDNEPLLAAALASASGVTGVELIVVAAGDVATARRLAIDYRATCLTTDQVERNNSMVVRKSPIHPTCCSCTPTHGSLAVFWNSLRAPWVSRPLPWEPLPSASKPPAGRCVGLSGEPICAPVGCSSLWRPSLVHAAVDLAGPGTFSRTAVDGRLRVRAASSSSGQGRLMTAAVVTSARRWQRLGPWRTTLLNQLLLVGYQLGVPTTWLARWYRRPRPPVIP